MKKQHTVLCASLVLAFSSTVPCYAAEKISPAIEAPPKSDTAQQAATLKSASVHKKSDCNHNGVDDLDEFWPPDCYGTLTTNGGDQ